MNLVQCALFILFVLSVFSAGLYAYGLLKKSSSVFINKSLYLGEVLLLGSIVVVGEMLAFSLIGLYSRYPLWGIVCFNLFFLFAKTSQRDLAYLRLERKDLNPPNIVFILLLFIFLFRNYFFHVAIDSHTVYLFTQRLWLEHGSSIFGSNAYDIRIFVPQFDAVPYSLGISVFGKEALFPQLVNVFWRLIVLVLVYGYTSYRFNKYSGLAAAMLVLFNDHFFISGANHSVIINAALVAFLFAAAYNFWEASARDDLFRFVLAIIFASQLIANKYQMASTFVFILILGFFIQPSALRRIKDILRERIFFSAILISFFVMFIWFIKNLLATGDPFFPLLAARFRAFGWIPQQEAMFIKVFGGIKPFTFIKYMNYFFIWPGVNAAKVLIITIAFLPVILTITHMRKQMDKEWLLELSFWLGLSVLVVMGLSLSCHQDPRYYRYPIAVFSFACIFTLRYILKHCFNLKNEFLLSGILLSFSLLGCKIIYQPILGFPTIKENIDVLSDRIHMDYAIEKYYPHVPMVYKGLNENKDKTDRAAWGAGESVNFPEFLIPDKPLISFWYTSIIKWDSFKDAALIIDDLRKAKIEWVMVVGSEKLEFLTTQEYAVRAAKFNRYPEKIYIDYGQPLELTTIDYRGMNK